MGRLDKKWESRGRRDDRTEKGETNSEGQTRKTKTTEGGTEIKGTEKGGPQARPDGTREVNGGGALEAAAGQNRI